LRNLARPSVDVERLWLQRFAPKCQLEHLDVRREGGDNPFTMRSLGVLLVALLGLAAVEGCSSDSPSGNKSALNTAGASGAAGSTATGSGGAPANPAYCPIIPGATQCILQDGITCGMNAGNGCVPVAKPDAGAH
jgi:hypothetical protein